MKKILFLLILTIALFAEELPKTNTRYVLIQSGVLNIRDKPINGKIVAKLNAGDTLTITGEAENDFSWKKVKTANDLEGYASEEFLGFFPPTEIQKGKLIGVVGMGDSGDNISKPALRILGASFSGKWYGFDGSGNFLYLMNYLVQNKKMLDAVDNGKKIGSFKSEGISKYGCQEYKGIKGNLSFKRKDEKLILGTFGIAESKIDYALTEKIPADISSNLLKEAIQIFKKNKVSGKDLENISNRRLYLFKSGNGKSYVSARYAITKEHAELHYISFVAEITEKNGLKLIQTKFESLPEERGNYGGSFHFMGLIDIDGSGTPAILYQHIGFDSVIYELFRILDGTIESVFMGGGDAC